MKFVFSELFLCEKNIYHCLFPDREKWNWSPSPRRTAKLGLSEGKRTSALYVKKIQSARPRLSIFANHKSYFILNQKYNQSVSPVNMMN